MRSDIVFANKVAESCFGYTNKSYWRKARNIGSNRLSRNSESCIKQYFVKRYVMEVMSNRTRHTVDKKRWQLGRVDMRLSSSETSKGVLLQLLYATFTAMR